DPHVDCAADSDAVLSRRVVFTDAERRQLAEKARALGRRALHELGTIVTPETLLRWHRELVARKRTFVERRSPRRPRIRELTGCAGGAHGQGHSELERLADPGRHGESRSRAAPRAKRAA